jgi:hypothetical protein
MDNKMDRFVTIALFVAGKQKAFRCWRFGGSQTVTFVHMVKVRRRSGAVFGIKTAKEMVSRNFLV